MGQVTAEGYVADTFESIRAEIIAELRAEWGASIPFDDGTFDGHLIAILSERLVALDELAEISFTSFDPDAVTGVMQRVLGLLTGTLETPASGAVAILILCGDDGTVVADGNVVSTLSTGKRFRTFVEVTLEQLDDWADTTPYAVGARVTNVDRCYQCITAGVSADAPTGTAADIVDGTVHWKYIGEGQAAADVVAVSEEVGPVVAVAGDLTEIETPFAGWNTAVNLLDAKPGRLPMTDEEFRLHREADIARQGTGTPDAIRAALLDPEGTVRATNATVFFNNTDETVDGIPPHSCKVLVQGGEDQAIWDCLWDNVPVGISTLGDEEGFAVDAEGNNQIVRFQRVDEIPIYITMTLTKNPRTYAGDDAVKLAIVTWGAQRPSGDNAVASAISAQAFTVNGPIDVTSTLIGTGPGPASSATIQISPSERAVYDTSRIVIISSDGVP